MSLHDIYIIGNIIRIGTIAYDAILDSLSIWVNRLIWIFKFYILKDKSREYIIDKRVTDHIIYCDGHFIAHTTYKIFMLTSSDFEMKKGFTSTNIGKVDLSSPKKYSSCKDNRFNSHIIKVEKIEKYSEGNLNIKFTDVSKEQKEKLKEIYSSIDYKKDTTFFKIRQDGQKVFSSFSFSLYMSIPKEFKNRKNLNDEIYLNNKCYGIFEYNLKIDRDSIDLNKFSPKLSINGNYSIPKHLMDTFYEGRKWRLRPALNRAKKTKISIVHQ
jgi:hypothetical protein